MTRTPSASSFVQPRLVSLLSAWDSGAPAVAPEQFTQRLGRLIDLSSSFDLAETLDGLPRLEYEPAAEPGARAREDFLRVHAAMIGAVMRSLDPERGPTRIRWPEPEPETGAPPPAEAYSKFYAANQREMEARVRGLQERVRDAIAGCAPQLAQLATLDGALGDALLVHSRRLFAGIPPRVKARLEQLRGEGGDAVETRLKGEVQALLLAEIEARLLPVQGLVEALEEHLHSESK
ncbi:DUF3348 family protein [Parahaliea mediterranea]|uniref:DUF3348 family protein n=1 Tax=Parahaliea mediterranea TaxID=651086 RepID=A0A939DGR5_9GAMM|nr:DUF3348 family protein [Parahaliea mediterranea]MBN7797758.1 DUF3348 family protein [Parahaliea mediterranea]